MVVIIDYGVGNLGAIRNMLKKIGVKAIVSSNPDDLAEARKLILPGIGAFDTGMRNLEERGYLPVLHTRVIEERTPILGICLGMQLLTKGSDEGKLAGLGWIDAASVRFCFDEGHRHLRLPHMGWNVVEERRVAPLCAGLADQPRFYFAHSHHVVCRDESDVLTTTSYGFDFVSSIQRDHIVGVQFHPEKSHKFGMTLLRNFAGC